jgi:hypothetical protein
MLMVGGRALHGLLLTVHLGGTGPVPRLTRIAGNGCEMARVILLARENEMRHRAWLGAGMGALMFATKGYEMAERESSARIFMPLIARMGTDKKPLLQIGINDPYLGPSV